MDKCERCGAEALNVHGVCRNCGWQAPEPAYDESPSFGETRPADTALPAGQASFYPRNSGFQNPVGGATAATQTPYTPRSGPRSAPISGGAPRFCGVCGARITGTEAFCGQCGAPITAAPVTPGVNSGPGRYQVGPAGWGADEAEAYTEALPEAPLAGRNPYANDPYARSYAPPYGSGPGRQPGQGLTRSAKITIGALFLGASVLIAIITITLAVIWFSGV